MKKILCFLLSFALISCLFVNVYAVKTMRGDANNDGKYNAVDYLLLRKAFVAEQAVSLAVYDVNGDGAFNLLDLQTYAKYLIKTGTLKVDEVGGWVTLYDWENESAGARPSYVFDTNYTEFATQSLSRYSLENNKNTSSTKALALYSLGLVNTASTTIGSNPTTGQENSYINTQNLLTGATDLRVTLSTAKTNDTQFFCAYIGCQIGSKHYFYKIDNASYKNEFNYFYFAGKTFTRFKNNDRFTYLTDAETKVITKDDIQSIKKIDFWAESKNTATPLIIDDIAYYDGSQGYDSSAEDDALPKTPDEISDGTQKYLAVAFDDGPQKYGETGEYYMKYYMDLAKQYNAHFTFFVGNNQLNADKVNILQRAVNEGHELANHTWSHKRLTSLSDSEIVNEITQVDNWLNNNIGVKTAFVRYPFYDTNNNVKSVLKQNCTNIKASIGGNCPNDYDYTSVDYRKWYYRKFIEDGTITLTHENIIDNVETVRWILDYYSKLDYNFVTVSEMFEIKGVNPNITDSDYYTVK